VIVLDLLTGYWWLAMELAVLGLLAWQLVALRRDNRRAAEAGRDATASGSAPRARRPEGQQQPHPR
jgi:hypothetical protein